MNLFGRIIALAAFLLSAAVASASIFVEFSFEDTEGGGTAGPITGSIFGLEADGFNQEPDEVVFSSIGGHTLRSGYVLGTGAGAVLSAMRRIRSC